RTSSPASLLSFFNSLLHHQSSTFSHITRVKIFTRYPASLATFPVRNGPCAQHFRGLPDRVQDQMRNSLTNARAMRDGERAARHYESRDGVAHAVHSRRPTGLTGGAMVRRAYRQRSLLEVLLPDADKLWDPTLRRIDALLDDDALVDRVAEALAQRHPESQRRGRLGTPADVVLRMLVLKHLHDWSFDECEREVRGSLVYRAFCRIDGERVADAKTLIRLAHLLDNSVLKDLLAQLVARGRERRVVKGRRLR